MARGEPSATFSSGDPRGGLPTATGREEFLPFGIGFGLALGHHGLQLAELPAQFAQGGL